MVSPNRSFEPSFKPARAILKAAIHTMKQPPAGTAPRAFITVSRQAGAGGTTFSHRLAQRLNQSVPGDWTAWDHELVEKVSAEHGIAKAVLEMIPYQSHTWFDDLCHSFSQCEGGTHCDESFACKRIGLTIGALASAGHAIIVGRGGRFITAAIPGGLHLRLIAPLEHRIRVIAEKYQLATDEVADRIEEMDRNREMFYHRHWPGKTLDPGTFSMTLNSGELSVDELVECVLPLVRLRETAGAQPNTARMSASGSVV